MRVAYDVTENVNIFTTASWSRSSTVGDSTSQYNLGNVPTVQADNPFIPTDTRARMAALGVTSLQMGGFNSDLGYFGSSVRRVVNRYVVGANGKFDALGRGWSWNAYFQSGKSKTSIDVYNDPSRSKYALAIDAVRDPTTGAIVCRSTLSDPTNGCVPYDVFGIGVNTDAVRHYILGTAHENLDLTQNVWAGSMTGEPFSNWAGPCPLRSARSTVRRRRALPPTRLHKCLTGG